VNIPVHRARCIYRACAAVLAAALFPIFGTLLHAQAIIADAQGHIINFDSNFNLSKVALKQSETTLGGTPEVPTLKIKTAAHAGWPGITIPAPGGAWDLSPYQFLTVDIHNTDNHDIDVSVRVDNPGADGQKNCMTERIGTQPDQRVTLSIILKRVSNNPIKLVGMQGFPQDLYANGGIDPAKITALTIFTDKDTPNSNSFEVSNIRVYGHYEKPPWAEMTEKEFFPFIDPYGQFKFKDWPGKVHADTDLTANRDAEAKALATTKTGPTDWDKWGGWSTGPTLKGTGSFRTEKYQNKWWLVDPDGHLFFSMGIVGVEPGGWAETPLTGRESYFQLPTDPKDPLYAFFTTMNNWGTGYGGKNPRGYDFSKANLYRKYGADWKTIYPDILHDRLRAWGINTIGNWSDRRVSLLDRTPYTTTFFYSVPNMKGNKVKFPDVFDPNFAAALEKGANQFLKGTTDDPWCIGYFVDNEMAWGGDTTLASYCLASPATQGAKQKISAWLQERYKTIEALNTAWGATWSSWDAFAADIKTKPTTDAATKDLTEFTGIVADTYFRSVKDAIKKIAPNRLYLGCRSVGGSANVVTAAVKYCDVVSYNRYCASVRDVRLPNGFDAPMMIGEYHFGAPDRGPFWSGLFSADNQEDRAKKLTAYVESALDNPQIVGIHWYQFGDDGTAGRIDGENGQIGFVDVCDTPYTETVQASRTVADKIYTYRAQAH